MGMDKYRIDESKGLEFGLYTLGDHIQNQQQVNVYRTTTYSGNYRIGEVGRTSGY